MLTPRVFPRYDVSTFEFQLYGPKAEPLKSTKMSIVSLAGFSVETQNKDEIKDLESLTVRYGKFEFTFNFTKVWETHADNRTVKTGNKIQFQEMTEYKKWLNFIKALHRLKKNH